MYQIADHQASYYLPTPPLGQENSEFKPVKLRLKIDLMSYPARAEGLVNSNSPDDRQFDTLSW